MQYAVIIIFAIMGCALIAILDEILNITGLRKRVKAWFKTFKGVTNG